MLKPAQISNLINYQTNGTSQFDGSYIAETGCACSVAFQYTPYYIYGTLQAGLKVLYQRTDAALK
ncbi:MAG: hypothetical protein GX128_07145 [Bacteroidales bacterium]|jgi:hypothetical protein|nr:hypothetical protein [Bacteroidales bacterium]